MNNKSHYTHTSSPQELALTCLCSRVNRYGSVPSYAFGFHSAIGLDGIKQPTASLRCTVTI